VALTLVAVLIFDRSSTWRGLVVPAVVAVIAVVVFATVAARSITKPVEDLAGVTRSLAAGNLLSRPTLGAPGELGELATAIHRLAEQLGLRISALQSEDSLLEALIETLNEGVLAISPVRTVVRINRAGRELLGISDKTPFQLEQLPRAASLRDAVSAALDGEVTEPAELIVGGRTVSLTARPLAGGGAVLALFDLTELRQLEMVRRDFVANVSHELRTPLTVIGGFAETLADDNPPESTRRQFASTIRAHTQRMQRIVDDLLDLSRLESGRWSADLTTVDVRAVAHDIFSATNASAAEKGIALETDIADDAGQIVVDRTALRQILGNLVENAVRHTDRGSVTVFAQRKPTGILIGVRDTGTGISREHVSRIFERFYRADDGRSRGAGGTGLGLAIVKHLVEAHGGHVLASSQPASGTTITAFIPQPVDPDSSQ
jgi:signal transduction histidine kinase/HAMP domain-containing protein